MTPPLFSDFISSVCDDQPRRKAIRVLKADNWIIRTTVKKTKTRTRISVLGREV